MTRYWVRSFCARRERKSKCAGRIERNSPPPPPFAQVFTAQLERLWSRLVYVQSVRNDIPNVVGNAPSAFICTGSIMRCTLHCSYGTCTNQMGQVHETCVWCSQVPSADWSDLFFCALCHYSESPSVTLCHWSNTHGEVPQWVATSARPRVRHPSPHTMHIGGVLTPYMRDPVGTLPPFLCKL